jgi:drug/metabolite transporter (DMT)-like permease
VLLKAREIRMAPAMIAAWQMIFGLVPLLVAGFVIDGNPLRFHWTMRATLCLFYLAIPGSAVAFLLLYWLLPRMSVTNLQTISFITPPGAVAFGWLLGGETFSLWALIGGALVLAGVWLIFRKARPAELEECETALPHG